MGLRGGGTGDRAVIGSFRARGRRGVGAAYVVLAAAQAFIDGARDYYVSASAFAIIGVAWMLMPATEITASGVRLGTVRPWRRRVSFSDVAAVLSRAPGSPDRWVGLRLTDGEVVTLGHVGIEHAKAIADLAGVTVEVPPRMPSPPAPTSQPRVDDPNRPLTQGELAQRFAALERGAARLAEQLHRSRRD